MLELPCVCGFVLTGENRGGLFDAVRRHTDEQHAELALSDQNIADYVDAALRSGPPRPRVEEVKSLEIRALSPELQDDVLRYFDYEAFAGNPAWANCYCQFFYVPDDEGWHERSAADNRAGLCERVSTEAMTGYVAYADGEPAGWCNAGRRTRYSRLDRELQGRAPDAEETGSIVCFVIAPPYRRHGLAQRLLDAAIEGFREQGLTVAEAYPVRGVEDDAGSYRGPVSLYERAGFTPYRELERQTVMRLSLT
jgi:GNAT superfamily N-acetyltransferase